jgi:predicted dehydrogenase
VTAARELRLGILGLSEGNGHPFSFSAILNGFDEAGMADAGWPVIHGYLKAKDPSEFGIPGTRVTHAWTQDAALTARLCRASRVAHAVDRPEAMIGQVDAIIIARDDYATHMTMARPFLEAGLPVFVDKPLSVDPTELKWFRPYLESGKLMSCAAMRYATELDAPRADLAAYGKLKLIRGTILNDWERYGVHVLDGVFGAVPLEPVTVHATASGDHTSVTVTTREGVVLTLDALGEASRTFLFDFHGTKLRTSHSVENNFGMFKRTLSHFVEMVRTGRPSLVPAETLKVLRTLIAARRSREEGRPGRIDDVSLS